MNGNTTQLKQAQPIDARSLRVECPVHKAILLPVTAVKFTYSNHDPSRVKVYLEALCVYCDKYRYLHVKEGAIAGLPGAAVARVIEVGPWWLVEAGAEGHPLSESLAGATGRRS